MKWFLDTHAGKGTFAVVLAVLILVWPPAASYLIAVACLFYGVNQFKESFRVLDAMLEDSSTGGEEPPANGNGHVERPHNGDGHGANNDVDMDELLAARAEHSRSRRR